MEQLNAHTTQSPLSRGKEKKGSPSTEKNEKKQGIPKRKFQKKDIEKPKRKEIGRKKTSILDDALRESRGK